MFTQSTSNSINTAIRVILFSQSIFNLTYTAIREIFFTQSIFNLTYTGIREIFFTQFQWCLYDEYGERGMNFINCGGNEEWQINT